ncbi:hypothetical protein C2I06_21200 [Niallia circulans]|uniref:helix-turn-helix domain-containing protein n=1 Tax=Niallia circulans TaxID=1397 RepID=UPI000F4501F3|nr:helix-turn-helix domain-containing protein [Niallia circulans]AYV69160.1 hypothetical protein C2I06_21200 [Niallia circulans]
MSKYNFFGEEIKRIRNAKKMTINELSEKSSVSSSYISQIENGKRDTPTPELEADVFFTNSKQLSAYLNMSWNTIVEQKMKLLREHIYLNRISHLKN